MLLFPQHPDSIFLTIFHEALAYVREVQLVQLKDGYQPTPSQREELDEFYEAVYPELVPFFSRTELIHVIDRLLEASRATDLYRVTDYHWLVAYRCLEMYCDLHNDDATGTDDKVGPYEIEQIDFEAIVSHFFFDTDFISGSALLSAEERAPGQLGITKEAWQIAAGLKPNASDLSIVRVSPEEIVELRYEPPPVVPGADTARPSHPRRPVAGPSPPRGRGPRRPPTDQR